MYFCVLIVELTHREAMKLDEPYASNIVSVKSAFRTVIKENELGVLIIEACPKGSLQ